MSKANCEISFFTSCKQNQEHVSERMYPAIVPKQKGVSLFITKMKVCFLGQIKKCVSGNRSEHFR